MDPAVLVEFEAEEPPEATGADGRALFSLGRMGPQSSWRVVGGRAEWGFVPPGNWTVQVVASDGRTWQGQVTTREGIPAVVALE